MTDTLNKAMISAQCMAVKKEGQFGKYAKFMRIGLTAFVCFSMLLCCVFAADATTLVSNITSGLQSVYQVITAIAIPVAVIALGFCGYQVFAGGEKGMEKAKRTGLSLVIALALVYLAPLIIKTVSGWFSSSMTGTGAFDATIPDIS